LELDCQIFLVFRGSGSSVLRLWHGLDLPRHLSVVAIGLAFAESMGNSAIGGTLVLSWHAARAHADVEAAGFAGSSGSNGRFLDGCDDDRLRGQAVIFDIWYRHRLFLQRQEPAIFENPIFAYPEETGATDAILADLGHAVEACPLSALMELQLDTERRLSLMAQTLRTAELRGNVSKACSHHSTLRSFIAELPTAAEAATANVFQVAAASVDMLWRQLGLNPDRFCEVLSQEGADSGEGRPNDWPLPTSLADVQVHRSCGLRAIPGFDAGSRDLIEGCRAPEPFAGMLLAHLPEKARHAIRARGAAPRGHVARCGESTMNLRPPEVQEKWLQDGAGVFAQNCRVPFLSYWPYPVLTITRCLADPLGASIAPRPTS